MSLAIFDLDNTLLGGDSDHAWGVFLCDKGVVDKGSYEKANDGFYQDYQNGTLDIHAFQAFSLAPLTKLNKAERDTLHQEFMRDVIAPLRLPKAEILIQDHKDKGDTLLIITATNAFITAPIAKMLGIENLLATTPEIIDGHFTGKISGTPCFQEGKVIRLESWLKDTGHTLDGSYFYSDSINDAPLFDVVETAIAVDPCPKLREHATEKGFPIISLR